MRFGITLISLLLALSSFNAHACEKPTSDSLPEKFRTYANCKEQELNKMATNIADGSRNQELTKIIAALGTPQNEESNGIQDKIITDWIKLNADTNETPAPTAAELKEAATEAVEAEQQANDVEQFFGAGWGIGVGAGFGQGDDRIESASLVNNIVRVDEEVTNSPRLFLETHYFFKTKSARIGHGPFATVNFGANGEDTLTSFGLGWMVGLKRPNSANSLNIGLGYVLDQGVKKFGSGIREGQPLPTGETEIRFEKESEPAFVILVSTSF